MENPLGNVDGGLAIGGQEVVGRVLRELGWHRRPEEGGLPVGLLENHEYLLHQHIARLLREVNPVAAEKMASAFVSPEEEKEMHGLILLEDSIQAALYKKENAEDPSLVQEKLLFRLAVA